MTPRHPRALEIEAYALSTIAGAAGALVETQIRRALANAKPCSSRYAMDCDRAAPGRCRAGVGPVFHGRVQRPSLMADHPAQKANQP